ncbi:hypothetical protein [Paenibacillus thalictri]|uniref:AMP-dependent synthetase and ligase n=1 Tax=Paenibacillus thalictri TaxID=2527873 RepID=A0A4Q9DVU3_9BACL|nr:hypothetical protein [Paenibacillus thalictri]TBL79111.1 hypothetical protein EYB31_12900 [Paenibacillus thalictri]
MQFANIGVQQALHQCEQIAQQLINQTQQASQNYQMLLQQEQQNAQHLEELAQREQRAAQMIQTALQGHQMAIQQLQHVTQLCKQVEQSVQSQSFNSTAMPQQQYPMYSQQNGMFAGANSGMNANSNYRSMH